MKRINQYLFLFILLFISQSNYAQKCPNYGTGKTDRDKHLNILKNHSAKVPKSKAFPLELNMLITRSRKPDINSFKEGTYVSVEGYIIGFAEEGPESCNCNKGNKSKKTGDVHISLALSNKSSKQNCIVVEITPSFKKLHPDYETFLVKGSRVRVFGYLIYDYLHEKNAVNTCETCGDVWRKTCWEVHPITRIEPL